MEVRDGRESSKGEVFIILLQLIDGLGSTRQARNPSARGMKGEQLGIRKLCACIV